MKVNPPLATTPPVSVTSAPPRPRTFSTESVLVSPFAPSLPSFSRFFNWLWSYIRPLFSFFIPKKEPEPAPAPSSAVLQALTNPKQKPPPPVELPTWAIPSALAGGAGLIYWQGSNIVSFATAAGGKIVSQVPMMIANAIATGTVNNGHKLVEQVAQKTIGGPPWMVKSASLMLTSYAVSQISDYFGYPMGRMFWVMTAFNTARLAWQSLTPTKPLRRIDVQRSFLT